MPPPGLAASASPRWNQVRERNGTVGHALVAEMVNVARRQPELADVSPNRLNRLIRRFIAAGLHERDLVGWLLGYADPTGETAVRNVMKERA